MAHGKPKGKIVESFKKRVRELEEKARAFSEHFRRYSTPRKWHTPDDLNTSLLDVANLHEPAWNRDDANRVYCEDVITQGDNGTSGDFKAMKKQIRFMAVEERAFRLRHASLVRCAALAHGRLAGHGAQNQSVFSILEITADNDLQSGGVTG
jgi:hypothetical protein